MRDAALWFCMIRRILLCLTGVLAAVLFTACVSAVGEISVVQTAVHLPVNELILSSSAACAALAMTLFK